MIVARSDVAMASTHSRVAGSQSRLEIRSWARTPTATPPASTGVARSGGMALERPVWTDPVPASSDPTAKSAELDDNGLSPKDAQKVRLIEALIEALTGRKIKLKIWNGHCADGPSPSQATRASDPSGDRTATAGERESGWGMEISYTERRWEEESLSFSAKGSVKTADGRSLEFSLSMGMRRTESSETSVLLQAGDAARKKDPLVVNFAQTAPRLAERATGFDLDADGTTDSVHFATGGSAFLARDSGTGLVDGSNLFGPSTGDGFAELSEMDSDNNGWIDAGDPVGADLRLWSRDESGQDWVWYLDEKGIGAISLARTATPFTLKDASGAETGSVGETGVWIGESGAVGTVNHVDLVA